MKRRYGYLPDFPDFRDRCFAPRPRAVAQLPAAVDIRNAANVVVDQGDLGSCTGNAIAVCDYFVQVKEKLPKAALPSRLAIYYGERVIEKSVKIDNGAMIRDGFKVLANTGVARESMWKYDISKFARKPPTRYFTEAKKHKSIEYKRLNNRDLNELKSCLYEGFPFVFGFSVYESFESNAVAASGMVPMPQKTEAFYGGHAVLCVGYDDATGRFTVQNSWGTGWGDKGFFYMPYEYLTDPNLADDFWTLRVTK
jgi:C1A family cysteine protease